MAVLKWHGDDVRRELNLSVRQRLEAACRTLRRHAREKANRAYRKSYRLRGGGEVTETGASRPGEYPRKRTGDLRTSFDFEFYPSGMKARWGTNVKYGKWLEFGTRRMAPRPWMALTNRAKADEVKRLLSGRLP